MEIMQWAGALLSIYGLHGMATGRIHAKDGISARTIYRAEEPVQFWVVCACYLLTGMLIYFAVQHRFG